MFVNDIDPNCQQCHFEVMPPELKGFLLLGKTILVWKTSSEIDNEGFRILRATKKRGPYESIGFEDSKKDATEEAIYSFVDKNAPKGKVYYKVVLWM